MSLGYGNNRLCLSTPMAEKDSTNVSMGIAQTVTTRVTHCQTSKPLATHSFIGTRPNDTGNFNGLMDDIALLDRALSEDEIKTIMDDGLEAGALAVSPQGKAATTWGALKSRNTRENFSR